jgi:hypothetical protein
MGALGTRFDAVALDALAWDMSGTATTVAAEAVVTSVAWLTTLDCTRYTGRPARVRALPQLLEYRRL